MKKLLSLLVAVLTVFVGAFAVKAANDGSIEINRTETNYKTTYNAYRILDLSYGNGSYAYSANEKWAGFFETNDAKACFEKVTSNGVELTTPQGYNYYKQKAGVTDNSAVLASCAKAALKYAKDNNIDADKSKEVAKGEASATIDSLPLGYYLVDSSLGAICHLNSTDKTASINEKNAEPTIEKEADVESAKIGDTVNYKVTINVAAGYEKYVFEDLMTDGLTYDKNASVKYYNGNTEVTGKTETIDNTATTDYTFKVDFTDTDLSNVTKIEVTYSATINKNAIDNNATQTNGATLSFGDNNKTDKTQSSTDVKTYNAMFKKVNDAQTPVELTGAKFKLYDALTRGNEIKLVKISDGVYRVAEAGETGVDYIEAGSVTIKGLANTKYYLEEVEAPEGYTKLGARVELTADDTTELPVVNTTGTVLPSTGGIGTKLFMIFGSLMVVVFGTLLLTKFRVAKQN